MVPPWPLLAAELHAARTLPVLSCCTTADETEATAFAASVTVVPLMAVMVVEKIPFVVVLGGFAGKAVEGGAAAFADEARFEVDGDGGVGALEQRLDFPQEGHGRVILWGG